MFDSILSGLERFNTEVLGPIVGFFWGGWWFIILLAGAGIFFSFFQGVRGIPIQAYGFVRALKIAHGKIKVGSGHGVHPFKALCIAVSATVGLGNIGGVAIAISVGGPGATLWMIVLGLIGMATKYTEVSLARHYRQETADGRILGGPMYYIRHAMFGPLFASLYAVCLIFAAFTAANLFQVNQVAASVNYSWGIPKAVVGLVMAAVTAVVLLGGIKRIANFASALVPFMGFAYIAGCVLVLAMNFGLLPEVIRQIVADAFSGTAAVGGFTGAAFQMVIRQGFQRGLFSSESGLGTSATAHSQGDTSHGCDSGLTAMLEPFLDTVLICTMTALVINITGAWHTPLPAAELSFDTTVKGIVLTQHAFDQQIAGFGKYFIPLFAFLFGLSTLVSWSTYGEQATEYLGLGKTGVKAYLTVYCLMPILGSVWSLSAVTNASDICLALLVFFNLWAIAWLAGPFRHGPAAQYFEEVRRGLR